MGTKLERIAEISATSRKPEFTSLYHLINADLLKECHKELDGKKAVGIDKVTKEEYGKHLDDNIADLVQRLKCGEPTFRSTTENCVLWELYPTRIK